MRVAFKLARKVSKETGFKGLIHFIKAVKSNRHSVNSDTANDLYISYIGIVPNYQKLGLATKLLESAQKMAKDYNIKNLSLDVREQNKNAIHVFKKFGFEEIERMDDGAYDAGARLFMRYEI